MLTRAEALAEAAKGVPKERRCEIKKIIAKAATLYTKPEKGKPREVKRPSILVANEAEQKYVTSLEIVCSYFKGATWTATKIDYLNGTEAELECDVMYVYPPTADQGMDQNWTIKLTEAAVAAMEPAKRARISITGHRSVQGLLKDGRVRRLEELANDTANPTACQCACCGRWLGMIVRDEAGNVYYLTHGFFHVDGIARYGKGAHERWRSSNYGRVCFELRMRIAQILCACCHADKNAAEMKDQLRYHAQRRLLEEATQGSGGDEDLVSMDGDDDQDDDIDDGVVASVILDAVMVTDGKTEEDPVDAWDRRRDEILSEIAKAGTIIGVGGKRPRIFVGNKAERDLIHHHVYPSPHWPGQDLGKITSGGGGSSGRWTVTR